MTLIVPRHPDRGGAIADELTKLGANVRRRAVADEIDTETDVYIADTMGELGVLFRVSPIVFMGKSMTADGGQNPLEPARLGCAVLYGPNMSNFVDMAARMEVADAATRIADERALVEAVDDLLANADRQADAGRAARAFAEAEAGVLDRVMADVTPFLDPFRTDEGSS